jgi:hypothetical protein
MANPPTRAADDQPRRYLSPQEFSRLSGLSLATVHRYLRSGKLPCRQPGGHRGRILISADALEADSGAGAPDLTSTGPVDAPRPAPATRLSGPRPRWARQARRPKAKES